jgi:DNA-binding transcriptional ArsR family regulator
MRKEIIEILGESAMTKEELAEELDEPEEIVVHALNSLEKEGLVDYVGDYEEVKWYLTESNID